MIMIIIIINIIIKNIIIKVPFTHIQFQCGRWGTVLVYTFSWFSQCILFMFKFDSTMPTVFLFLILAMPTCV